MRSVGRRLGLITGASAGVLASLLCAYAISQSNFALFCIGSMLYGTSTAFSMQYRFVAAESVLPERAGQAISYVLLGGVGSALIGPQAAMAARSWWSQHEYAGSFALVGVMYAIGALVLANLRAPQRISTTVADDGPSIRELMSQPILRTAVLAGAVAFGVMSFIMTAAPVSMHSVHHHSAQAITWTIQSHILAMYLPSLFSGTLVTRYGERAMMLYGSFLLAASAVVSLVGHGVPHYWIGLVLLGAGWNLLFTAGTALLATHYTGPERHRAQGINDFVVFTSQACVSFLAGVAVLELGWEWTNLSVLPLLALMIWIASRNASRRSRAVLPAD
jgi:MFS family permease